jgi:ligand-binding SRPBCC domain-containing protein
MAGSSMENNNGYPVDSGLGCLGKAKPTAGKLAFGELHECLLDSKPEPTPLGTQLQFDDWIPFPLPRVFAFFSNPENLPRIMPAAMGTRLDELHLVSPPASPDSVGSPRAAGIGTLIVTSFRPFRFLPMRVQWVARITEFEWNHHFADLQQRGFFRQWHHRHEFFPEARNGVNGTLVRDLIHYEIGFGPVGRLANTLFVARRMCHAFEQRQQILPQLLS